MRTSGAFSRARAQLSRSSSRCSAHHSSTRRSARAGDSAGDHFAGLDRDDDRLTGVGRVEMRHAMLSVIHRDDDPVELADPRHLRIVSSRADNASAEL